MNFDPQRPDATPHSTEADEPRLSLRREQEPAAAAPKPRMTTGLLESPRTRRRSAAGRHAVLVFAVLGTLAVLAVLLFVVSMRRDLRANLPQLDGRVAVPGLQATVTVARDAHGIVNITATSMHDVLFAQGYTTAADRMWQMDALRRHATGELAELLGRSLVEHDKLQRLLQLRATADRAIAALPPAQLADLQAYADGVNAWLASHADQLPVECHLLHYTPATWQPRDSLLVLLVMYQDLSTEFPTKIARESLEAHLPPELTADMYPTGSWRDHPPGELVPNLTSPRDEIQQIPLDPSQSHVDAERPVQVASVTAADQIAARRVLPVPTAERGHSGSNNWAVSGAHTSSGGALVSNDMHLSLSVPDIWYQAGLHLRDGSLNVTGVTLPGLPFVLAGRNAHVAWGYTAELVDVQDLVIEHTRGSGDSLEFERPDGTWASVGHHREVIRVRAGLNVTLDVLTTEHTVGSTVMTTPVLSPLYPSEKRTLALEWTAYDPASLAAQFRAVDEATSGAALDEALRSVGGPPLNVVWGDDAGHIGYHAIGRVPIRGPLAAHAVGSMPLVSAGIAPPTTPLPMYGDSAPGDAASVHANSTHAESTQAMAAAATDTGPPPEVRGAPVLAEGAPVSASAALAPSMQRVGYVIGSPIPTVPVDAMDPAAVWTDYVPYDKLPAVTDPLSGVIATANARITPDGYPYQLAVDWMAPYRLDRIVHQLYGRNGFTAAEALALQMDVYSDFDHTMAQRLAYAIDRTPDSGLGGNVATMRAAANILRSWDGNVTPGAVAPNLVEVFRVTAWPALLVHQLRTHDPHLSEHDAAAYAALYSWGESLFALEQLVQFEPARWLPTGSTWDSFLVHTLATGMKTAQAPADLSRWTWGSRHFVQLEHPVLSSVPWMRDLLGVPVGSGRRVVGGDLTTVKQTGRSFGPSERFTADLGQPGSTTLNITTGQSGNPLSPWYLDQLPLWLGGRTLPQPLDGTLKAAHTLTMTPQ